MNSSGRIIPDYIPILVSAAIKRLPAEDILSLLDHLWYTQEPFIEKACLQEIGSDAQKRIKWDSCKYNWDNLRSVKSIMESSTVLMAIISHDWKIRS